MSKDMAPLNEQAPRFSRRTILKAAGGLAAAAAVTGVSISPAPTSADNQPIIPTPTTGPATRRSAENVVVSSTSSERKASAEAQSYSDGEPIDVNPVGTDGTVALIKRSDGKFAVATGTFDGTTTLKLAEKAMVSGFYPWSVAQSETNPDIIVWVGSESADQTRQDSPGRLGFTLDGGKTVLGDSYKDTTGAYQGVQISPDNKYAYIDRRHESGNVYKTKVELKAGGISATHIPISGLPAGVDLYMYGSTPLEATADPNVYINYAFHPFRNGYFKLTYTPDGISAQQFNTQEGGAVAKIVRYTNTDGQRNTLLFNPYTESVDNTHGTTGTVFPNDQNETPLTPIQPKAQLYAATPGSIQVNSAGVDTVRNTMYMGVTVIDVNNVAHPYVESVDLATLASRELVGNGELPSTGYVSSVLVRKAASGQEGLVVCVAPTFYAPGKGLFVRTLGSSDPFRPIVVDVKAVDKSTPGSRVVIPLAANKA